MVLAIDVGNTNIVMGVYKGDTLLERFRLETDKHKTADELGILFIQLLGYNGLNVKDIEGVIVASVVPPIMYSLERAIKRYVKLKPMIVNNRMDLGLNIKCDNVNEVGIDRIVNAVAAYDIYKGGAVIIDFGTATTLCALNSKGDYLGGVIAPGIKISSEALFEKTAKLPKIEIDKPKTVIGTNTVTSMQSGLIYGYTGLIDYLSSRMKEEMREKNAVTVATGGLAGLISLESKQIDKINPNLTLEGLRIIYNKLGGKNEH